MSNPFRFDVTNGSKVTSIVSSSFKFSGTTKNDFLEYYNQDHLLPNKSRRSDKILISFILTLWINDENQLYVFVSWKHKF